MYKALIFIGSILGVSIDLMAMKEGAGIVPFCVHEGKSLILIGKTGNDWADFGGFRDKTDKTIEYAAAREFSEETRHVFGQLIKDYSLKGSINYILPRIKKNQCFKKISKNKDGIKTFSYSMYFVEVDYIPAKTLNNAKKVPHYEKEEYCWVSAEDFLNHCANRNANDVFEHKALRRVFWNNLKSHQKDLPIILSAIQSASRKPKVDLPKVNQSQKPKTKLPPQPQAGDQTGQQPGPEALKDVAAITPLKLAFAAVMVGICYWGYSKYTA